MKLNFLLLSSFFIFLYSCIKDEEPFREADIVKISLSGNVMANAIYEKDIVTIIVYDTTGFHSKTIVPEIQVSPGASIYPASGTPVTLNNYYTTYKVIPEDGIGEKKYVVQIAPFVPLTFDFEDWKEYTFLGKKYEMLEDPLWANANPGIRLIYPKNTPFPTRKTTDSYSGNYAVLLETRPGSTIFNSPIYAGSMYRGVFNLNLNNPVASAKFGQYYPQYMGKPSLFTGYYKYKPGDIFKDEKLNVINGKIDECDIYAVIFKVTKGEAGRNEFLTADEIEHSDKIIARAVLEDRSTKNSFTKFEIPFTYSEEMNYNLYDYKIAIVFSSSKEGAFFRGAVGSTLIVDEIEVKSELPK